MDWLYDPGLPVWGQLLMLAVGCLITGTLSYLAGHKNGAERMAGRIEAAVDAEFTRRRNALADAGRTTARRPEHEGEPPAVNRRVKVVGRKPAPADRPPNQL